MPGEVNCATAMFVNGAQASAARAMMKAWRAIGNRPQ
jgi:hypothetical protein